MNPALILQLVGIVLPPVLEYMERRQRGDFDDPLTDEELKEVLSDLLVDIDALREARDSRRRETTDDTP